MFAVIFTAKSHIQDKHYLEIVERLRNLACTQYGCIDFISTKNEDVELTISYWPNLQSIQNWKQDIEHNNAQKQGKQKWYSEYKVEIVAIKHSYKFVNNRLANKYT